jgi:osmotically-inducible protein OsmY
MGSYSSSDQPSGSASTSENSSRTIGSAGGSQGSYGTSSGTSGSTSGSTGTSGSSGMSTTPSGGSASSSSQSSQPGSSTSQSGVNLNVQGTSANDKTVAQQVTQELRSETSLAPALSQIQISINNGKATLNGSVGNEQQKRQIESAVQRATGVTSVENQLQVKSTGTSGTSPTPQ